MTKLLNLALRDDCAALYKEAVDEAGTGGVAVLIEGDGVTQQALECAGVDAVLNLYTGVVALCDARKEYVCSVVIFYSVSSWGCADLLCEVSGYLCACILEYS